MGAPYTCCAPRRKQQEGPRFVEVLPALLMPAYIVEQKGTSIAKEKRHSGNCDIQAEPLSILSSLPFSAASWARLPAMKKSYKKRIFCEEHKVWYNTKSQRTGLCRTHEK